MKYLALILTNLVLSTHVWAGYTQCPAGWSASQTRIYNLLKSIKPLSNVGECKVEFHLCDSSLPEVSDTLIGDIMISKRGKSYYLPLYAAQNSKLSHTRYFVAADTIDYSFGDRAANPLSGKNTDHEITFNINPTTGSIEELSLWKNDRQDFINLFFIQLPFVVECHSDDWDQTDILP